MPSKTISLKEETYDRLASVKGEGESFSDVIDRLLGVESGEHPLHELVGLLDDEEVATLRERSRAFREDVEGRMDVEGEP